MSAKKQQLIDYLKSNYAPGQINWANIGAKFGYSPEAARSVWKDYRKKYPFSSETAPKSQSVNIENGTLQSETVVDFEPKTVDQLAALHKIDTEKYSIVNYWTKQLPNGKFTSSVFCKERKLGGPVDKQEILDSVKEFLKGSVAHKCCQAKKEVIVEDKSAKDIIFFVADEHVGAAVTDGLYDNEWNAEEYRKRKLEIVNILTKELATQGKFRSLTICNLGDTLDGFSELTTRGGHKIPQNMTNKEAIKTYLSVNAELWDSIVGTGNISSLNLVNVENSNHGGLGWDAAANIALEAYLSTKYKSNIVVHSLEDIVGTVCIGTHYLHLTHGKDEKYMKRNLPLHLDFKTEIFFKEYLDKNGYTHYSGEHHVIKGDLHKFATEQGKFFSYTNVPSLFGSSAWTMANFGHTRPGLCYAVFDGDDPNDFSVKPYWFD